MHYFLLQTQPLDLLDFLVKGSPIALAFMLVGFVFGWFIPGAIYKAEVARNEKLEDRVQTLTSLTFDTISTLKEAVKEIQTRRDEQDAERARIRRRPG